MRPVIAALIAPALLGGAPRLGAQNAVPRLEPTECPFERGGWARDIKLECAWLVVPEMRDHPSGRTVRLAVAIVRAKNPVNTPLVMLHGGPGLSGLRIFFPFAASSDIARTRDMVVYDQRGAGYSEPKLCPDYGAVEDSARRLRTVTARERLWDARDRACVASLRAQGIDPAAYNTLASAWDLVDLRKALGYATWDMYGSSYGARLAQEAMRQDPRGIRSVVMASPVMLGPARFAEVGLSIQRAFERVWKACAGQVSCNAAFPNVSGDFYALYDALSRSPLPAPVKRDNRVVDTAWIDGDRLVSTIRNDILGRPGRRARLPLLVNELRRGDKMRAAETLTSYDSNAGGTNQQVLIHLVNCYDIYGAAFRAVRDSANALARPAFRSDRFDDCPIWQTRFANPSEHESVRSDIPTLILSGRFDDRTPTEHARRIAATLSHSYLYEFPNEGHDPRPGVCHLSILKQFLGDPSRAPDASCIAAIPPVPFVTAWDDRGEIQPTLRSTIAFVSNRHDSTADPTANPQRALLAAEIYLMNGDGTNPRRLTENTHFDGFPVLSPDGKRIVFDSNRLRAAGDPFNTSDLFLMNTDGTAQTFLIRGSSATWSPDGRKIAFHASASGTGRPIKPDPGAATNDNDIFVVNVDDLLKNGARPKNITNSPAAIDDDPDWSPDGQKIMYTSHAATDDPVNSASAEIYVIDADGTGSPTRLTNNTEEERAPAWSPDGKRVVFSCRRGGPDFEICVMNADGTGQVQITDNTVPDLTASWSPDGKRIVFHRRVGGRGQFQLFSVSADGTGEVQLTFPPGLNAFPNWGEVSGRR